MGVVGDGSFKIGANKNAGNNMIPRETGFNDEGVLTKGAGDSYDHWARGGGSVKHVSQIQLYVTVLKYLTCQFLQVIQHV